MICLIILQNYKKCRRYIITTVFVHITPLYQNVHITNNEKAPKSLDFRAFTNLSAVRTGLEPATPGVTGPYSNQLNYRTRL